MESLGAPEAALDFATRLAESRSVGMIGVLEEFHETGAVDVGRVFLPLMANTNGQFILLNTRGEGVTSLLDFSFRGGPSDAGSRAFMAAHPNAGPTGRIGIAAIREMPDGVQRFVLSDSLAECRACAPVGSSITHVDFRNGTFMAAAPVGFQADTGDMTLETVADLLASGDDRMLQSRLTLLGYQPGGIDGRAGPNTLAALHAFQAARCLPRSDTLSAQVISGLSAAPTLEPARPVANCIIEAPTGPLPLLDGAYAFDSANCAAGENAPFMILSGDRATFGSDTCRIVSADRNGDVVSSTLSCRQGGGQSLEPFYLRLVSHTAFLSISEHSSEEYLAQRCEAGGDASPTGTAAASGAADAAEPTDTLSLPFPDGQYTWWDIGCADGAITPMEGVDAAPVILRGAEVEMGNARCEITGLDAANGTLDVNLACDLDGASLQWNWRIDPLSETTFEGRLNEGQVNSFALCAPPGAELADASPPQPSEASTRMTATLGAEVLTAYDGDMERIALVAEHADHAALAWAAYESPEALAQADILGWTPMQTILGDAAFDDGIVDTVRTLADGTAVATLFRSGDGKVVLAFRGSTSAPGDWVTNTIGSFTALSVTQVSDAVRIAERVAEQYPGVTFVGHSLGGRLAQAARLATGNRAVVFNSAPLGIAEDTDRIVRAIIDGLSGADADAAPLLRFRGSEDALTRIFSPRDIDVSNVIDAQAVASLPDGTPLAVILGHAIADQIDVAHNIAMLYGAMEQVRMASDEGWVPEGPFPAGTYATDPRYCKMTAAEYAQFGDTVGRVRQTIEPDGAWSFYKSICGLDDYSERDGLVTLDMLCNGEGIITPVTRVVRRVGATSFEQDGRVFSLCEAPGDQPNADLPADGTIEATDPGEAISAEVGPREVVDLQIPPMQRGATESLRVVTNWPNETPGLAILSPEGWIDPDRVPPAAGLPDPDPAALSRAIPELERSAALTLLREQISGGRFISHPGHQTFRLPADRLGLVQDALAVAITSPDPDARRAQSDLFLQLPDFIRMNLDRALFEQLHFASSIGLDFIGTWQVGEVGSSRETWQITAVGVPVMRDPPTPQMNRNGILLGLLEVAEVTGIFATETTAEVEFLIRPEDDISADIAEADSLGLRSSIVLRVPQGRSYRDILIGDGQMNGVWTATFRRYDDGWRISDVR